MKDLKSSLLLYAVTDRYWLNGRKLKDDVEKAILGGATMIQLREKNLSTEDFIKEALEIKEVCKKYDIPFIINDSLEVFLAVDADGIHVGQNDLSADIVRKKIGPNKILGVSAETVSEALLAEKMGADYLGVGTIFSTSTKLDAINVTKEELARISYSVNIPVVAIGGITLDNIKELKNTMISGISVVSAIFKEEDIVNATRNLLKEVNKLFFNSDDYKLFIVDYDGTLLNSLSMWEDIASRYVKSKGIEPELDLDKIVKLQTNDETALYLSKKYFNNINPNDAKAIARHEVLATLDDIVKEASILLNSKGRFAMVHRPDRILEIFDTFRKYKIEPKRLMLVYPKKNSECNHILIEGIKDGAKGGLKILNPLFVYGDDGKWTKEILEIYNYERK